VAAVFVRVGRLQEVKFTATKRPGQQVPTVGISLEKAFDI
jgi:hypothetical protein